jgi:lipopolysaccharide/colanic/teichoic acid biosynthesis glycosyltransferase
MIYSALTVDPGKIGVMGFGERLTAAALLVLLAPVLVASALVVACLSRRSPLIAHRRVGWRGADLWMIKLRSMWGCQDSQSPPGFRWIERVDGPSAPPSKHAGDPRVPNAFARFLRRHSLDEIPQLWHVIRGEMSLVGPRPLTAAELRDFYGADAAEILQVKPGIAGLWQVSGRNRLGYAERRKLDLALVRRRSPRLYVEILLRTIPAVWTGANSW